MFTQNKPPPGPLLWLCLYIIKSKKQPRANGVLDAPDYLLPRPLNCMHSILKVEGWMFWYSELLFKLLWDRVVIDILDPPSFLASLVFPRVI